MATPSESPRWGASSNLPSCYAGNPLVNVLCCGLLPKDRLVFGRAVGEGNLAVLLGSTTGRDGIGGVSVLASAAFGDDADADAAKRPNVQVGDPFEEKRLIEATLELLDQHLVLGIQDLGGAGLTCATSETASRGGVGMDVNVDAVPLREPGLEPFEVMTSESQERMLAIVTPGALNSVLEVCRRWEVRATVVGQVTTTGRLRVLKGWDGEVLADVPAASLHEDAPVYHRPMQRPAPLGPRSVGHPGRRGNNRSLPGGDGSGPALPAGRSLVGVWPVRPSAVPATPSWPPALTPPCSASLRPASGPRRAPRAGVSPCRPTGTRAGARSTPAREPGWSWPSRPSTWPAWEPGRWRWSTA